MENQTVKKSLQFIVFKKELDWSEGIIIELLQNGIAYGRQRISNWKKAKKKLRPRNLSLSQAAVDRRKQTEKKAHNDGYYLVIISFINVSAFCSMLLLLLYSFRLFIPFLICSSTDFYVLIFQMAVCIMRIMISLPCKR